MEWTKNKHCMVGHGADAISFLRHEACGLCQIPCRRHHLAGARCCTVPTRAYGRAEDIDLVGTSPNNISALNLLPAGETLAIPAPTIYAS